MKNSEPTVIDDFIRECIRYKLITPSNRNMKKILITTVYILWACMTMAQTDPIRSTDLVPAHPRILMNPVQEATLKKRIIADSVWARIHKDLLTECEAMVELPLPQRVLEGRRMLGVSKAVGRRLFFLSYAYRMTGQKKYAERPEREMLAVADFSDWNPSHFLDVAEMTLGVAVGYDWLHDYLSADAKKRIRECIRSKGIEPSDRPHGWLTGTNNWNQICNAGVAYGAVAIWEDYPELSTRILNRAVESIKKPMHEYAPDGVYPEGYSYWSGGTDFNVLFLNLLEENFGTDFGLAALPGFMKTPYFRLNLLGPNNEAFQFGDGSGRGLLSPSMFWFAKKNNDPALLRDERLFLTAARKRMYLWERLLPAILVWGSTVPLGVSGTPKSLNWSGCGQVPVALMRSSWHDPKAVFAGIKGGTAAASHAHMDVGSFVMEANGIRWAVDLGPENYHSVESKGVDLWNMKQESQRWTLLRYRNMAHNTLIINGELQRVSGNAALIKSSERAGFMSSVFELSSVYAGQLRSARRGIAIVEGSYVLVRDELIANDQAATVQWNMVTDAEVNIADDHTIVLTRHGKKLTLKARSEVGLKAYARPAQPLTEYDSPNPGKTFVGFEATVPASAKAALSVALLPDESHMNEKIQSKRLTDW